MGSELSAEAQVAPSVVINGGIDWVRGTNGLTKDPLPLMPAPRVELGLRITRPEWGKLKSPYFSFKGSLIGQQSRVQPGETPSSSYELVGVGLGAEIAVGAGTASVDLGVDNVFNEAYRDHLSRYKEYADNPGRNLTLRVRIPLGTGRQDIRSTSR